MYTLNTVERAKSMQVMETPFPSLHTNPLRDYLDISGYFTHDFHSHSIGAKYYVCQIVFSKNSYNYNFYFIYSSYDMTLTLFPSRDGCLCSIPWNLGWFVIMKEMTLCDLRGWIIGIQFPDGFLGTLLFGLKKSLTV